MTTKIHVPDMGQAHTGRDEDYGQISVQHPSTARRLRLAKKV